MGIALILLASASTYLGDGFLQFTRSPALLRDRIEIQVGVLSREGDGKTNYWARRIRTTTKSRTVQWADGRTCSGLEASLRQLSGLVHPKFAVPGLEESDNLVIAVDGVGYSITSQATFDQQIGYLKYSSNRGTPLAAWVDASLALLAPCWQDVQPLKG